MFDALTGKEIADSQPFRHQNDIVSLSLSQSGPSHQRLLTILDKNSDLFLTAVYGPTRFGVFALGMCMLHVCHMCICVIYISHHMHVTWQHHHACLARVTCHNCFAHVSHVTWQHHIMLCITPCHMHEHVTVGSMVSSICWNDSVNMLAAMQDNKFVVWYHPAVIYSDKDLLPHTCYSKEGR